MKQAEHIDEILKACIHCGMCLPACPTYQVTGNEGDSPRGRLYIINDYLQQEESVIARSEATKQSIDYLDNCLECSACETVCPSGVQYIDILEHARHDLKLNNYNKGLPGLIRKLAFKFLLPNRSLLRMARALTNFTTMIIPLHKFIKIIPNFEASYYQIKTNYSYKSKLVLNDISDDARSIALPLGCVMDTVYNHVHWDTIKVLNEFGYHVYIPESNCCGALAYHSGESQIGLKQLKDTVHKLTNLANNSLYNYPIVMNSAGCGAFLKNHSELKIWDLIEALKNAPVNAMKPSFIDTLSLRGAPQVRRSNLSKITAIYHPACHLNHQQGLANDYVDFLKQIPGLELLPLYEADMCCGSAGFYNLIKSKMANEIGERKAKNIKAAASKTNAVVLTANPGCMSQIQAHLNNDLKVLHPISLIRAYLENQRT